MASEAEAFVPTLERARIERTDLRAPAWWRLGDDDFLQDEPTSVEPLAAVVVRARVQSRDTWERLGELPLRFVGQAPTSEPPAPETFVDASHRVFGGVTDPQPKRCTLCAVRRGLGPCSLCTGTGKVML